MSDDSDSEIDTDTILTEIDADHEVSGDEFEDNLTTIRKELEGILALDEEEVRIADAVLRQLATDEVDFTEEEEDLYNRIAPHADQLGTSLKYDDPDWIGEMTPAAFTDEGGGNNDE